MEQKISRLYSGFQERRLLHRVYIPEEEADKESLLVLAERLNRILAEADKKHKVLFGKLVFSLRHAFGGYYFDAIISQAEVKRLFSDPYKKALSVRSDRIYKSRKRDEKLLALSKESIRSFYKARMKDPISLLEKELSYPLSQVYPDLGKRTEVTSERVENRRRKVASSISGQDVYFGSPLRKDPLVSSLKTPIPSFESSALRESKEEEVQGLSFDLFAFAFETKKVSGEKDRKRREVLFARRSSSLQESLKKGIGSTVLVSYKEISPEYVLRLFQSEAKKRNRFSKRIESRIQEKMDLGSYFEAAYNLIRTRQVLFNENADRLFSRITENASFGILDSNEDYFAPFKREKKEALEGFKDVKRIRSYSYFAKEEA